MLSVVLATWPELALSPPPVPSSSGSPSMAGKEGDEAWPQADMRAMRRRLLSLIHRHYLEAISRLPAADLRATLARGLLVAGHCYGPLHPVHNILLNSIWYAAAFPLRAADRIDVDMVSNDGIVRACHRSLDGLVASLHRFCPHLSTGDALWNLMSAHADLSVAVALANRTSRSSAQRAMQPQAHGTFQAAAEAARHPNPAAFGLFSSSVLPPDLPNDLLQPPLMISTGVLDVITSQRKLFKDTEEAVLKVVSSFVSSAAALLNSSIWLSKRIVYISRDFTSNLFRKKKR